VRQALGRLTATVTAALLLAGCTSGSDEPSADPSADASSSAAAAKADHCRTIAPQVLAAIQDYVDAYGTAVSGQSESKPVSPAVGDRRLRSAITGARKEIDNYGCDAGDYQSALTDGLGDISVRGPLANAVLLRLKASMSGSSATDAQPVTREVSPGDDLPTVLSEVAPGSTLRLAGGTYRLPQSLVLLQGVTLVGRGSDRTVLRSTASDTSVLVLTDGRVDLRRLTLRHAGPKPASVLVGGPSSSIALTEVVVSGGRSASSRAGGNGVLMSARGDAKASRATTLEVTGSTVTGNDNAGILLTGGHRASVVRTRFGDNGQCGICFADASSGAVHRGNFSGNAVGVAALGRSRPAVLDSIVSGGQIGLQAAGDAQLLVRRTVVDGASRAGLLFGGRSGGRVAGATCRDVRFGVVVATGAAPYLTGSSCSVVRSR
jgi:Right handed beta helix region